ncbi:MAG: 3-phosphoshikimate 1-carboxyvinyltransferase [Bacteroidales bacterium]|nr:3-phosphoshikimate 1-carboxyvinyltransferase [Bacteroidales bacterium]MDY0217589.1 3-phosphoshikimate 1-carboxyvinyltransferase [Bacteroidales bacterium]
MNKSQNIIIHPLTINGKIHAASSKSYYQRALAISLLTKGKTILNNTSDSGDVMAVKRILSELGLELVENNNQLVISNINSINAKNININVGESGLALRMFSFIISNLSTNYTINGEETLLKRPLKPLIDNIIASGLNVSGNQFPIHISGNISKNPIEIDGSFSSQMLSGLLITLPLLPTNTLLKVSKLVSKPYIDMTLELMKEFGVKIEHENYQDFHILGNQTYQAQEIDIEGDWSGAANWLVGAAISGKIIIDNLNPLSLQADRRILEALQLFGAKIRTTSNSISVETDKKNAFNFDASDCPDLFPPLLLLAAAAKGTSRIKGRNRLLFKESNRSESLIDTFTKLGADMYAKDDEIIVNGNGKLNGNQVIESYNDHRIVMIATISGTLTNAPIEIKNHHCVNKSYPQFFEDFSKCSQQKPLNHE